jgi:hypothetical protein
MSENVNITKATPRDFFLNVGVIAGLYFSVISLLRLIFSIINNYFPDVLNYGYGYPGGEMDSMRWSISALIIIFPLFVFLSYLVNKDATAVPEKRNIWIRKWSTYLTLFLTGATIAVDLVFLINTFLSGEISSRFVLKVLSVLIVSAAVFAYYFYDLKKENSDGKKERLIATAAGLLVLVAIIIGFLSVGSPSTERDRRMDERRVQDLTSIQNTIVYTYWQKTGKLPATLGELNDPLMPYVVPVDPETKQPYEYHTLSATSFKLCATFETKSDDTETNYGMDYGVRELGSFKHDAGRVCFERTIDPALYPVESQRIGPATSPVLD